MYVIYHSKSILPGKTPNACNVCWASLIDAIANRPKQMLNLRKTYRLSKNPLLHFCRGVDNKRLKKCSVMLSVVDAFSEHQFVIAGAPSQEKAFYQKFIKNKASN